MRLVVSVSVKEKHKRRLLDVKNAFVNATLKELIYISQHDGFVQVGKENWVYVLKKALYGLRHSSREWYLTLDKFLIAFGFQQFKADPTLYVWNRGEAFVMIVVYVDDIMISGDSDETLDLVVDYFKGSFEVRVDSKIEKFFEFSVQDSGSTVKLHNAPMIRRLLKAFKMQHCKQANTPLPLGLDLAADSSKDLSDTTPYRQLIGSLLHLANMVRPDIAFAVSYLYRFMHKPTEMLWKAAKHVLRYLSGTEKLGMVFHKDGEGTIRAYSDADWGSERPSRKSITGTVITCAGSAIHWRSKQQSIVAQSSKESEFVALSFCVRDVLWLHKFKKDFDRFMDPKAVATLFDVIIGEDNQACLAEVRNGGLSELSKHVDLKYQMVIDHVQKGEVRVEFVPSQVMVADVMTKNLSVQKFLPFRKLLGMQ